MINKKFELHLETVASEFNEQVDTYDKIIIVHHTDADGLGAALILKEMLQSFIFKRSQKNQTKSLKLELLHNTLELNWEKYIENVLKEKINLNDTTAIFFSDLCPHHEILNNFLEEFSDTVINVYILDHHLVRKDLLRGLNDNIYNCNPTDFGLHGLKEIVGGTVAYLFAKAVDKKNEKLAWMAAISMGGDTLQHYEHYTSYNRLVIEDAIKTGKIKVNEGICAYGGQFLPIAAALSHSILPYIPKIEGDTKKSRKILEDLSINPKLKIPDLTMDQCKSIENAMEVDLIGEYLTLEKRQGILQYVFEHAQLISLLGHDQLNKAFQIMGQQKLEATFKNQYLEKIEKIVKNLTTFVKISENKDSNTKSAIVVDFSNSSIEQKDWSDMGSFSSINKIYDPMKVLFIGGNIDENTAKFSVRCQKEFIDNHSGMGVNIVIKHLCEKLGATGGGHDLAGGIRIEPSQKIQLFEILDELIENM